MLTHFKENKILYYSFITISVVVFYFLFTFSKIDIHIYLNKRHHHVADFIFKYITHIGDGKLIISISIILLFVRFRYSLYIITPYLISGVFVQLFKRIICPDLKRPKALLHKVYDLYFVSGVKLPSYHTFPSGHSATVFGLLIITAFFTKNNLIKGLCLLLACLVAWSRVYLSFHFLVDIYFGSLLGIIAASVAYLKIKKINTNWIDLSLRNFKF